MRQRVVLLAALLLAAIALTGCISPEALEAVATSAAQSGESAAAPAFALPNQGPAPELTNDVWINSAPLQLADLRGKVVIVEFWTYG